MTMSRRVVLLLQIVAVLAVVSLYLYGAMQQVTRVNLDMDSVDQSAYLEYAAHMIETDYAHVGTRNRMPVYPFLQSLFYDPVLSDQAAFMRAKIVNVVLSLALLTGLATIFLISFGRSLQSVNLLLVVMFTIFVFKAGWVQVELLFYFLNFCLFLMLWRLLSNPGYGVAVMAGVVAGVAHLSKASVLPGLVIFLLFMTGQFVWTAFRTRQDAPGAWSRPSPSRWLIAALLVGSAFLITVFPYISTSKRVFGQYFYNVNSTFYMWYDSWDEVERGTRAYGDRDGWPQMPADQIPSLSKYLREHTRSEIVERVQQGAVSLVKSMSGSYGYFKYLAVYVGMLVAAALWQRLLARQLIAMNALRLGFVSAYVIVYFLLYAWFGRISDGNRLMLAQCLPLFYLCATGTNALLRRAQLSFGKRGIAALTVSQLAMLGVIVVDIFIILTGRVRTMVGGL